MHNSDIEYELEYYKPFVEISLALFFSVLLLSGILTLFFTPLSTSDYIAGIVILLCLVFLIIFTLMRIRDVKLLLHHDKIVIMKKKKVKELFYRDIKKIRVQGMQIHIDYRVNQEIDKMTLIQFGIIEGAKRDEVYHVMTNSLKNSKLE